MQTQLQGRIYIDGKLLIKNSEKVKQKRDINSRIKRHNRISHNIYSDTQKKCIYYIVQFHRKPETIVIYRGTNLEEAMKIRDEYLKTRITRKKKPEECKSGHYGIHVQKIDNGKPYYRVQLTRNKKRIVIYHGYDLQQ